MSSADEPLRSRPKRAGQKKKPAGEYETGYCKPPEAHRYKNGQRRPRRQLIKQEEESLLKVFKRIVAEKTTMNIGEEVLNLTRGDVVLRANFILAMQGNQGAMQNILSVTEEAQLFQEPVRQGYPIAVPYRCQSVEEYEEMGRLANEASQRFHRQLKDAEEAEIKRNLEKTVSEEKA